MTLKHICIWPFNVPEIHNVMVYELVLKYIYIYVFGYTSGVCYNTRFPFPEITQNKKETNLICTFEVNRIKEKKPFK